MCRRSPGYLRDANGVGEEVARPTGEAAKRFDADTHPLTVATGEALIACADELERILGKEK